MLKNVFNLCASESCSGSCPSKLTCMACFKTTGVFLCLNTIYVLQVRYHEDFEKNKGSFTPTTSDPVTERVKKNTQDFSDISYRGIQRRVVEMERRRAIEHDQETITGTR